MIKGTAPSRLIRYVKTPIRALRWAGNYTMRKLMEQPGLGVGTFGYEIPRSYAYPNLGANKDDLHELIRAASVMGRCRQGGMEVVEKGESLVVGRIDEDAQCEFTEDVKVGSSLLFPAKASCGRRVRVLA